MSLIVFKFRAYTQGLIKSVLFRCHYSDKDAYPTFQDISKHLNKANHKVSFVVIRDNVGSTTFEGHPAPENIPQCMQHSFGIPRLFFRFNLTSAISAQPYAYVHWARFEMHTSHRASFEGTISRNEWTTGPIQRENINPFCYVEDIIPSRFALGKHCLLSALSMTCSV